MRYKIHRADLGCLDTQMALTRLQKQCLPYDKPATTTFGYWWLVHSEDGVPVAFAGLVPSQRWSDCGYLCRAGVLPKMFDPTKPWGADKTLYWRFKL